MRFFKSLNYSDVRLSVLVLFQMPARRVGACDIYSELVPQHPRLPVGSSNHITGIHKTSVEQKEG
jgi:hypothetical protein